MDIKLLTPQEWSDYELIDSGNFEKLERFGRYVTARPEPQAIWNKSLPDAEWNQRTNAYFRKDKRVRSPAVLQSVRDWRAVFQIQSAIRELPFSLRP